MRHQLSSVTEHPPDDPTPIREEIQLTERIGKASKILGMKLLDHSTIGEQCSYSFSNTGRLP